MTTLINLSMGENALAGSSGLYSEEKKYQKSSEALGQHEFIPDSILT